MLLLAMIALPSIDAGVIDLTTNLTTSPYGRVLNAYTPLTNSNIKTAAQLWVSNQASATSTYGLVHNWDLSQVTNLAHVWCGYDEEYCGQAYQAMRNFNGDFSMWDVSKVAQMESTFYNAYAFNGDISKWDVSKVTIMQWTFHEASAFDRDLNQWDVAKVTIMQGSKSIRILGNDLT
jgi:surface protein